MRIYIIDESKGTKPEPFTGFVDTTPTKLQIFKENELKPEGEYLLTDFYVIASQILFHPNDFYNSRDSKEPYFQIFSKLFLDKIDLIKKEQASYFDNYCFILFARKKIEKIFNGVSDKKQSIVMCFDHSLDLLHMEVKADLEHLINQKVGNAIKSEQDPFKLQALTPHRNIPVIYWTDYYLSTKDKEQYSKKIKPTYLNINENGVTYNEQKVIILFFIKLNITYFR